MSVFGSGAVTARANIFDLQRHGLGSTVEYILERKLDRRFEILSATTASSGLPALLGAARTSPDIREEHVEEVRKAARASRSHIELKVLGIRVAAITPLLFGLLRGLLPIRPEDVVFFALIRIPQN